MNSSNHRQITEQALQMYFHPHALEQIVHANLAQDRPRGQIGHPEYHFDSDAFAQGLAYMEANREQVQAALQDGRVEDAWAAFGRLTHAGQDFYAHSNYVVRWLARYPQGAAPAPEAIAALDEALLSEGLRSGRIYMPWEPLSWIPALRPHVMRFLPPDSHAWMNLDSPARGPAFAYAWQAAFKRTRHEYDKTQRTLNEEQRATFHGWHDNPPPREV